MMRKLVFILIGFIAAITFIRAMDRPADASELVPPELASPELTPSEFASPDLAVEISGGVIDSPQGY
jgi:hypothetical protein